MTGEDFTAWMRHMNFKNGAAAEALDLSRNTIPKYISEGAPGYIDLACAALAGNVRPWSKRNAID